MRNFIGTKLLQDMHKRKITIIKPKAQLRIQKYITLHLNHYF